MLGFLLLGFTSIISFFWCVFTTRRLYSHINRFRFDESVYTLLFGFIHLHYFVWAYILIVAALTVVGVFVSISFLT